MIWRKKHIQKVIDLFERLPLRGKKNGDLERHDPDMASTYGSGLMSSTVNHVGKTPCGCFYWGIGTAVPEWENYPGEIRWSIYSWPEKWREKYLKAGDSLPKQRRVMVNFLKETMDSLPK